MTVVHVVELREWIANFYPHMSITVMFVASTREKAIEYIKAGLWDDTDWFCISAETVDADGIEGLNVEFYDIQGNKLDQQPASQPQIV